MPVRNYFGGKGGKVLKDLERKHGRKKAREIFYATVNRHVSSGSKAQKEVQPRKRPGQTKGKPANPKGGRRKARAK